MRIKGWRYFKHAAVPTTELRENPDLAPIQDGSIWKLTKDDCSGRVLFARYTTDFDCAEETAFWHIIKEGPFVFSDLSKKYQKHVKKAFERCEVKRLDPAIYAEEMYEVYKAAYDSYEKPDAEIPRDVFLRTTAVDKRDFWGAFSKETGKMAGWMTCKNNGEWTETVFAKYHPKMMNVRASDVIHYAILDYYLNQLGQKFINSGTRTISHQTNVQGYKEHHWKFRKAYCRLHIEYNPKIRFAVKILYFFRKPLLLFDKISIIHLVNSVLSMESIARGCR